MKNFVKKALIMALSAFTICNALTLTACEKTTDLSTLSISCIGDSLTMGQGIENDYPSILASDYNMKNVRNYGIGWSTCSIIDNCSCHKGRKDAHNALCLRYPQIPTNANVIAVMCGVNDSGLSVPLGTIDDDTGYTFYGALNILCQGLKNEYQKSYVFFMTSFHYDSAEQLNDLGVMRKDYYEKAIKEICQKYGFDVLDTYNQLDFDTQRDTVDNVHPNQNFVSNVWIPAIVDFLSHNYKAQ